MNVYTIEIAVQDRQQTFHREAAQSRLAHGEASEKRQSGTSIGASLRQLLMVEPARVEPTKPVGQHGTQVPARNRG